MDALAADDVIIEVASPSDDIARAVLRAYTGEVASRWLGRLATVDEVSAALRHDPSDGLVAPYGVLLLARRAGTVVGCAGLRLLPDGVGEVKRLFVAPQARGVGLGRRLMLEVEAEARARRVHLLRLDTRADLVEARGLYAALGYVEVPAFNDSPYAEHWLARKLHSVE